MLFTMFIARAVFGALLIGLAFSAAGWTGAAQGVFTLAVWAALIGAPVFVLEALGVLSGAARFFFGRSSERR